MVPDFALHMRRRRQQLDLTRGELAQLVGCSPDMIKKIESGERRPSKQLASLLARHLQIEPASIAGFISDARRARPPAPPLGNLPTPLTGLIGREEETQQIIDAFLDHDARLVTVVGAPGVGKSRVALHAAEHMAAHFPDGVWYLSLATLDDPSRLIPALAQLFGMPDGAKPNVWLSATLRPRHLLLVLDDFDAVVAATRELTELLMACGHVNALLTSSVPLRSYGEHRVSVPPLPMPGAWATPLELAQSPAVRLYVARVRAHRPDFRLTRANAAAVAEICTRMDGLPLAIELAAGRADAATPDALLATITATGRLDLASDQIDHAPLRATLRQVISGSVGRLNAADQALFAALGVFQAPFDLDAALAVVAPPHDSAATLRARLAELATRNLIQLIAHEPSPRYRLLDTLREAAAALLGPALDLRRRHAAYFARQSADIDPARLVGDFTTWRVEIRRAYPDWLAALHFALTEAPGDNDSALRIAACLGHFWYLEGEWESGAERLTQVLARPDGTPSLRARAGTELGVLLSALGRYAEAATAYELALEQARLADDLYAQAWTLSQWAHLLMLNGQTEKARACIRERLSITHLLNDDRYRALTLQQMGIDAVETGDYAHGMAWLHECLDLWTAQAKPSGCGTAHSVLGMADLAQGDATAALTHFQTAWSHYHTIGQAHGLAWVQRNLGLAFVALGDLCAARMALAGALARYEAMHSAIAPIMVVEAAALIAAIQAEPELAGQLMASASAQRSLVGLPLTENSRQIYARLLPSGPAQPHLPLPWDAALDQARTLLHGRDAHPT